MIDESIEYRLMAYFFEQSVSDEFYELFYGELTNAYYQSEQTLTEDELVKIGVQLMNQYLNI